MAKAHDHGTHKRYVSGCRCETCTIAQAARVKKTRRSLQSTERYCHRVDPSKPISTAKISMLCPCDYCNLTRDIYQNYGRGIALLRLGDPVAVEIAQRLGMNPRPVPAETPD